jgi:hypothetical protein
VDNEWIREDLAEVYSKIGPVAIPALAEYLLSPNREVYAAAYAGDALTEIGKVHPETRLKCIHAISRKVEQFEENSEELNALLIGDLVVLKAVEALPLIERAFAANRVDEFIIDLDYVLVGFGLKEREDMSSRLRDLLGGSSRSPQEDVAPPSTLTPRESYWRTPQTSSQSGTSKKAKNKMKMAKASRKKNRSKK